MTVTTQDSEEPRAHGITVSFGSVVVCTWDEAQEHAQDFKNKLVAAGIEYFNVEVQEL